MRAHFHGMIANFGIGCRSASRHDFGSFCCPSGLRKFLHPICSGALVGNQAQAEPPVESVGALNVQPCDPANWPADVRRFPRRWAGSKAVACNDRGRCQRRSNSPEILRRRWNSGCTSAPRQEASSNRSRQGDAIGRRCFTDDRAGKLRHMAPASQSDRGRLVAMLLGGGFLHRTAEDRSSDSANRRFSWRVVLNYSRENRPRRDRSESRRAPQARQKNAAGKSRRTWIRKTTATRAEANLRSRECRAVYSAIDSSLCVAVMGTSASGLRSTNSRTRNSRSGAILSQPGRDSIRGRFAPRLSRRARQAEGCAGRATTAQGVPSVGRKRGREGCSARRVVGRLIGGG
jgi:hypothetical protein